MIKVLDVLQEVCSGINVLPCARVNVDYGHFEEYSSVISGSPPQEEPFEYPPPRSTVIPILKPSSSVPSLIKYFIDGSRRTHRVADVVIGNRYYPIVAGQIGVAVVERQGEKLDPLREYCIFRNIISLPDQLGDDSKEEFENELNERVSTIHFQAVSYTHKENADPVDLAVAKIMNEMQKAELKTAERLTAEGRANERQILLRDGPLQFGRFGDISQQSFRGIIGVSKSFRPNFQIGRGRGRKDIGSVIANLNMHSRTEAYKYDWKGKTIGTWYLRVRDRKYLENPLDGVLKIERIACDEREQSDGFDAELLNTLSLHILRERNVTPYGADSRWAGHLYPIYLAERFIRASFVSDLSFTGMFGRASHGK